LSKGREGWGGGFRENVSLYEGQLREEERRNFQEHSLHRLSFYLEDSQK
jgi:hypothetical protein